MKRKFHHMLCLLVLLITVDEYASAAGTDVIAGFGLKNFKYTEFNDHNRFLDGETGLIPGVNMTLHQDSVAWFTEIAASLYTSNINYDGQTQSAIPVKAVSYALIFDTHFKLAKKFAGMMNIYAGAGYRYWLRNIHSSSTAGGLAVAGISEQYAWPYLLLGYQDDLFNSQDVEVGVDIRYMQMVSAKMNINFLGYCGYDNTQVNLGNRGGWRIALPVKRKVSPKSTFFITPYYEIIDIGKSNTVALTRNGSLVDCNSDGYYDGALEPRSETRNFGIELTWLW